MHAGNPLKGHNQYDFLGITPEASILGSGAFGTVYAMVNAEGQYFAVKSFALENKVLRKDDQREIQFMVEMNQGSLVNVNGEYALVMPIVSFGSLDIPLSVENLKSRCASVADFMMDTCEKRSENITPTEIQRPIAELLDDTHLFNTMMQIAAQTRAQLADAHNQNILHLDFASRNILLMPPTVNADGSTQINTKLMDYGLAHKLDPENNVVSVKRQRAEIPSRWTDCNAIFDDKHYTVLSDIYAYKASLVSNIGMMMGLTENHFLLNWEPAWKYKSRNPTASAKDINEFRLRESVRSLKLALEDKLADPDFPLGRGQQILATINCFENYITQMPATEKILTTADHQAAIEQDQKMLNAVLQHGQTIQPAQVNLRQFAEVDTWAKRDPDSAHDNDTNTNYEETSEMSEDSSDMTSDPAEDSNEDTAYTVMPTREFDDATPVSDPASNSYEVPDSYEEPDDSIKQQISGVDTGVDLSNDNLSQDDNARFENYDAPPILGPAPANHAPQQEQEETEAQRKAQENIDRLEKEKSKTKSRPSIGGMFKHMKPNKAKIQRFQKVVNKLLHFKK